MVHGGLNPSSCDIHCGFDGGQGILKVALTITDRLEDEYTGRSHYSDVSNRSKIFFLTLFMLLLQMMIVNLVKLTRFFN